MSEITNFEYLEEPDHEREHRISEMVLYGGNLNRLDRITRFYMFGRYKGKGARVTTDVSNRIVEDEYIDLNDFLFDLFESAVITNYEIEFGEEE
jgi:hypothetical protein